MSSPGPSPDWEEFRRAMRDLEARVAKLEARLGVPREVPAAMTAVATAPPASATSTLPAHGALAAGAGAVPIAGRALLGIAAVLVLYVVSMNLRRQSTDMRCLDTIARYLFYTFVIDFSLEMLDLVQRTYEADESFRSLDFMVHTRLWTSQVVIQIFLGTLAPLCLLATTQLWKFAEDVRRALYVVASSLTLTGILAMRWNVVSGRPALLQEFSRLHVL